MPAIEAESALDGALNGKVKRKSNNTRNLKAKASRVAKGSPEVMVKITGFGKGAQHVKAHLDYISRNGKVELETDRGEILEGKAEVKELFKQWADDFGDSKRHKNQRDTMHMVLSMPEGTPQEAVRQGARGFAAKTFGENHEYVFALHTDEPHPHVHITVKMLGFDGTRLNPRKADLQNWREAFAQEMRDQGVEAEATPRPVRGVVKKPEKNVIRHIELGDETHKPRVPRVKASQVKEAVEELTAEAKGLPVAAKPWEEKIKARQKETRAAWLEAAKALDESAKPLKEKPNERPNYDQLDAARVRSGQRAAAVYQSGLEKSGRKASAIAIARLRNLPRIPVVQHERPTQVLLYEDASRGVGRHGAADHDVRRPRAGVAGPAGSTGSAGGGLKAEASPSLPVSNKELAEGIRGLVATMPSIDTKRHELKQQLAAKYTRQVDQTQSVGQESQQQAKRAAEVPPKPPGKDVER
jgi:type IV secretory pathway VirD2 relaxase